MQLVHSLETEFEAADLQLDPANNLLMAVGRDIKALTECVALHHLRLQPGVFRLKGRLNLPSGATGKLAKNTGNVKALQVGPLLQLHPPTCSYRCVLRRIVHNCEHSYLLLQLPVLLHV